VEPTTGHDEVTPPLQDNEWGTIFGNRDGRSSRSLRRAYRRRARTGAIL